MEDSEQSRLQKESEFTGFMRRLMAVPHAELKERLDEEKRSKRKPKSSPSDRASSDND